MVAQRCCSCCHWSWHQFRDAELSCLCQDCLWSPQQRPRVWHCHLLSSTSSCSALPLVTTSSDSAVPDYSTVDRSFFLLALKLLVFATPGNLILSPQLLMTDPSKEQVFYHFIIFIIWYFFRMLSCSIGFLHCTSSSAFFPSGTLLGIPWVPPNSSLASAKWDSVEDRSGTMGWGDGLRRSSIVRYAVLGFVGVN